MKEVDLLVIGAGPAGLCAAQYGANAGMRVLVVENAMIGGEMINIDKLENYPGFLTGISATAGNGKELTEMMRLQAVAAGAEFIMGSAESVSGNSRDGFTLALDDYNGIAAKSESIHAGALILASGAHRKILDVPGEMELYGSGVSYCAVCDGPFFKGKKIFVIGGGDSACAEARFLSKLSPDIHLVHRRDAFRAQKSVADRVFSDPAIKVRFNTNVVGIKGNEKVEAITLQDITTGKTSEERADAVFIFTGIVPRNKLVSSSTLEKKPALDENGFVITDHKMASSVPGIYAAGDVRAAPFRQIITAASDGAIAAHSAAEYLRNSNG
ncbi:MAG: FAD-dependent oxidoreductase [Treponema sp.]|jgi:thioredoxin reductase (NADPH)|nr:FAD-dependent oxidoreductase [Treponema sp.]